MYRAASASGLVLHVSNSSSLWQTIAPRLAHHNNAIKHALIAYGAAYHLFRITDGKPMTRTTSTEPAMREAAIAVARHYDKAITSLKEQLWDRGPETVGPALICSQILGCMENLRGNYRGASLHLEKGIGIVTSSVNLRELDRRLRGGTGAASSLSASKTRLLNSCLSDEELAGVVNYFRQMETAQRLFTRTFPLHLSSKLYGSARLTTLPPKFTNMTMAYSARVRIASVVLARDWKLRERRGDEQFWASPPVQKEQAALATTVKRIEGLYSTFLASKYAPAPYTAEGGSCFLDMLVIKSLKAALMMMPLSPEDQPKAMQQPHFQTVVDEVVYFAEKSREELNMAVHRSPEKNSCWGFTVESALIAPTWFAMLYAHNPATKNKALNLLRKMKAREGPWDAQALLRALEAMSKMSDAQRAAVNGGGPKAPRLGSEMSCMGFLTKLQERGIR